MIYPPSIVNEYDGARFRNVIKLSWRLAFQNENCSVTWEDSSIDESRMPNLGADHTPIKLIWVKQAVFEPLWEAWCGSAHVYAPQIDMTEATCKYKVWKEQRELTGSLSMKKYKLSDRYGHASTPEAAAAAAEWAEANKLLEIMTDELSAEGLTLTHEGWYRRF